MAIFDAFRLLRVFPNTYAPNRVPEFMLEAFKPERPDPGPTNAADQAVPEIFILVAFVLVTFRVCIFELLIEAEIAPSVRMFAEETFRIPKFEVDETLRVVRYEPEETFRRTAFALAVNDPVVVVKPEKVAAPVNVDAPWTASCC
jgi:hypothetical protein